MTDYEAASLAAQQAALRIAAVGARVSAAVPAVGIRRDIRAMVGADKERAVILDRQREAGDKRHEEVMAAHAETMAEGTRRHEETMAALAMRGRGLEAMIAGLERRTAGLETVVERTVPTKAGE